MTGMDEYREQAKQTVEQFVQRFDESYRLLASHAALPLVLTPELVNYLRNEFLRFEEVPWVAEVDLLMSDLCSQVGYELYAMDTHIRAYLLEQMKVHYGEQAAKQRMQEVAQVLISYVSYLSRVSPGKRQEELQAQQWAAMVYLGDRQCKKAAEEIADGLQVVYREASAQKLNQATLRSELARLTRITQELSPQLAQEQGLLDYAKLVQKCLRRPETVSSDDLRASFRVGEMELVPPVNLIPDRLGEVIQPPKEKIISFEGFPPVKSYQFTVATVDFEPRKKSEIQIFLAYAREDQPAVFALYERLKAAGYKPWLDQKELVPGENWQNEIVKAIKASHIFIACLSSKSVLKEGYIYTQEELQIEFNTLGKMASESIYLIPLRLDECEMPVQLLEVRLKFRDIQWIDYWKADGFEQLEKVIAHQFIFDLEELETLDPEEPVIVTPSKPAFKFGVVFVNARGEEIRRESKQVQYFTEDLGNGIGLDMVAIPGGNFMMGTEDEEIERLCKKYTVDYFRREKPQHRVTVQSFFMGKYPVTQAQWREIASRNDLKVERNLDVNPARFKDDDNSDRRPVERVTWYGAIEFCQRLSKLTGREYRLPSEAEWEYSCRAGTTTPFYFGETIIGELANYDADYTYADEAKGQYREATTSVGQFTPNSFGLYDMLGNVWEWCKDDWHKDYKGAPTDGSVWESDKSERKVNRGGSWFNRPTYCRSAYRYYDLPGNWLNYIGLRVVCAAPRT